MILLNVGLLADTGPEEQGGEAREAMADTLFRQFYSDVIFFKNKKALQNILIQFHICANLYYVYLGDTLVYSNTS